MTRDRVGNSICLLVLVVAAVLGWYWIWGLMFLYWTVPSVISGQAFLLTSVERKKDPVLFWAVVVLWILFGLGMIVASLFPAHAPWLV